jgi:hypothetical protein
MALKIIEYHVLKRNLKEWKKDDVVYKEPLPFHPTCTAVNILRKLIKSVFDICYCVIEKSVQNVGKELKCNRFLLKYATGGLQLHPLR